MKFASYPELNKVSSDMITERQKRELELNMQRTETNQKMNNMQMTGSSEISTPRNLGQAICLYSELVERQRSLLSELYSTLNPIIPMEVSQTDQVGGTPVPKPNDSSQSPFLARITGQNDQLELNIRMIEFFIHHTQKSL